MTNASGHARYIAKYIAAAEAGADEERDTTIEAAAALPGFIGRIAPSMLRIYGVFGYKDEAGRKVLLRL